MRLMIIAMLMRKRRMLQAVTTSDHAEQATTHHGQVLQAEAEPQVTTLQLCSGICRSHSPAPPHLGLCSSSVTELRGCQHRACMCA